MYISKNNDMQFNYYLCAKNRIDNKRFMYEIA